MWGGGGGAWHAGLIGWMSSAEPERACVYLPVDGVEEADERVDGGGEAGAQFGGDATEEVGNHVGVFVESRAHLLHRAAEHRRPSRRSVVAHLPRSLARSRSRDRSAQKETDLLFWGPQVIAIGRISFLHWALWKWASTTEARLNMGGPGIFPRKNVLSHL